jgi:hypothetical protein
MPPAPRFVRSLLVCFVFISVLRARPLHAQTPDAVGVRAQGMAGAFTAVADDATATWWNPAGLASGAYLDSLVEYGVLWQPHDVRDAAGNIVPSVETRARGIAFAFPAMGLSYYRLQISEIRPVAPILQGGSSRESQGASQVRLRSVVLNQFGATFGQSLSNHLVLASTVKLVRASVASAIASADDVTYELAHELEGDADTHPDLDVGAMAILGIVRLGVSVKNIRTPDFGPDDDREELKMRARAGVAISGRPGAGIDQFTVAFDGDLMEVLSGQIGEVQNIAGGVEAWMVGRRVGVRGGLSKNLAGIGNNPFRPSGGVSLALRTGTYFEGQYTAGPDKTREGWGFNVRVTF